MEIPEAPWDVVVCVHRTQSHAISPFLFFLFSLSFFQCQSYTHCQVCTFPHLCASQCKPGFSRFKIKSITCTTFLLTGKASYEPYFDIRYSLCINTQMTPYTPGIGQIHHTKLNSHLSHDASMALCSAPQSNFVLSNTEGR